MHFQHKLHILYLMNDTLHHCVRRAAQDVKQAIQEVVVPIYCNAFMGEPPENQQKLTKVLGIWESNNYFDPSIIQVRCSQCPVQDRWHPGH